MRRRVPTNWVSGRTLQPSIESVVANSLAPSDFLVDGQVSGLGTVHPLLTLSFVSTWILPLHVVSSTLKRKSSSSVMDGLQRRRRLHHHAHWKVGPAPVFGASQPLEPAEWLALLILKAGDVESNPGPQNRKLPPSALTTQTTTLNSTTHSHATTSHPNKKLLTLLQLNINSITNKYEELKLLVTELQPDIITIQETKLKKHNKTPQIPTYSAIRTDRANGKGGGLLTYIKHNITFSDTKIPNFINPINTELQIIQLHVTHKKNYTIANIYIPPRNTTSPDHATCDADITSCIQYITNLPNSIISGDINAHSPIWHSHTTDHRGDLIADLLGNSDHITLNTNTHTRLPFAANQRPTSPDITSITTNLYNRTHWETLNALNSDHLPILTTINTRKTSDYNKTVKPTLTTTKQTGKTSQLKQNLVSET